MTRTIRRMRFAARPVRVTGPLLLIAGLAGCNAMQIPEVSRFVEPELAVSDAGDALQTAAVSGGCFATDSTPAVIETRTEQVQVTQPVLAEDGAVITPATYNTVTDTRIVKDRQDVIVQTVCPGEMSPQFIASLQRALHVRGFYAGAITAELDRPTRAAVRKFQGAEGLPTTALSLAAAKRLGLAVYSREEATGG
ncbi:peptidoglycan-binding domain-containing protein [Oceaniglobus indicus]|uniref:peptidoglycan-binding domain-containing protein n=1 Tax=Oceaniglobus indicus TaxID=2047749 RepID=UPI000C17EC21|nr:peptidoglycan-binding domain-containing protein [Oceaniglobus indicus]